MFRFILLLSVLALVLYPAVPACPAQPPGQPSQPDAAVAAQGASDMPPATAQQLAPLLARALQMYNIQEAQNWYDSDEYLFLALHSGWPGVQATRGVAIRASQDGGDRAHGTGGRATPRTGRPPAQGDFVHTSAVGYAQVVTWVSGGSAELRYYESTSGITTRKWTIDALGASQRATVSVCRPLVLSYEEGSGGDSWEHWNRITMGYIAISGEEGMQTVGALQGLTGAESYLTVRADPDGTVSDRRTQPPVYRVLSRPAQIRLWDRICSGSKIFGLIPVSGIRSAWVAGYSQSDTADDPNAADEESIYFLGQAYRINPYVSLVAGTTSTWRFAGGVTVDLGIVDAILEALHITE